MSHFTPPHHTNLPILQKLIAAYKIWQEYFRHFPKGLRYTLGSKIDMLFIEIAEFLYAASLLVRERKIPYLQKATLKLDLLKFFLQVAWESKALDNKKYIQLSECLTEIGRMLGGWQKHAAKQENPAPGGE